MTTVTAIFLGDTGVGKSAFLSSVSGSMSIARPTIGVDSVIYRAGGHTLRCWDTGGSPRFMHVIPLFARKCDVAVYMFDATKPHTFASVQKWHEMVSNVDDAPQEHVIVALRATGAVPSYPGLDILDGRFPRDVMADILRRGARTPVSFELMTSHQPSRCCFGMC